MFELSDHTGDIAIKIKNSSLEGFFQDAIRGLYAIFLKPLKPVKKGITNIELEGRDLEELLVELLNEMIYLLEVNYIVFLEFKTFQVVKKDNLFVLNASFWYDTLDKNRYVFLGGGVKAATYHNLRIKQTQQGYETEIVIDI